MEQPERARQPGDDVGLGHVVDNPAGMGTDHDPMVEEASEASFPASDPPGFTPGPATPAEHEPPDTSRRGLSDPPSA